MSKLTLYKGERVTLMACSSCNAKCNDCYIGYNGNRDPNELFEIAKSLTNNGKHVRIDGAEVLTNLDYLKTLKLVGQNWIMTNGLRLYQEPSVIDLLKKYGINTVYMSYHFGIQDVINSIPSLIVEEVIKRLKAADFNLYLNCTLTNKNYKDIAQYAHQAYVMGAKGIGFNKIFQQGKATDISELDMNNLQLLEFFKLLNEVRSQYDPNEFYITRGGSLGHDLFTGKDNFKCNAGHNHIMITPDSNVYCCNSMCKAGYEIGKFHDGEIYIYEEFQHDESICLAELLGFLNENTIDSVNSQDFPKLVKKYQKLKK